MKTNLLSSAGAAAVLAVLANLAGCASSSSSSSSPASEPVDEVRSAQTRNMSPTLTPAESDTLAKGDANFAISLLETVTASTPDQNVFLSPHSISIALAMTYAGARTDTAAEMKKALHFDLPDDRVHVGFDYLDLQLASRGQNAQGDDSKPFRLNIANSIWGQKGSQYVPTFLDTIAENYGSGLNVVDFIGASEPSRLTINSWVEQKTEDRVKDLIPQGAISPDTRMVLVNAVYFNAAWATKFDPNESRAAQFTKLDGSTTPVTMMKDGEALVRPFSQSDDFDAVALPYDGKELSMLVILPKAGTFATFESTLTGDKILDVLAGLTSQQVELSFPKLNLETNYSLTEPLKSMGMKLAFDPVNADFTGLMSSSNGKLSISDVLHKTFLQVDEAGTEAAAATAVIVNKTSVASAGKPMVVDHPFITAIVDNQTRTLVFVGRIVAPSAPPASSN